MFGMTFALVSILFAGLLPTAFVKEIPATVHAEKPITIVEARDRLIKNHGQRIFFRTQGTIIADKHGPPSHFILLDETAATDVLVSCDDHFSVGDEVSVICTAMQPQYENPTLLSEALSISVIRHHAPSAPRFVHPVDLAAHRNDFNLIRMKGCVTDAFYDDVNPSWTIIVVTQDDIRTLVWTPSEYIRNRHAQLIDAEMEITGIVLPGPSNFYRSRGPWVLASSPDALKVLKPSPTDPFTTSASPPHRQLMSGRIIANWGGDSAFMITDDGRRVRIRLLKAIAPPNSGERVTASGFLQANEFGVHLYNAICRSEGEDDIRQIESPAEIAIETLLLNENGERRVNADLNGHLIQVTGTVIEQHAPHTDKASILLSSGVAALTVHIGKDTTPPEINSTVSVTGVCIIEDLTDMDTGLVRATGMSVALRDSESMHTLAAPPWWTATRLLALTSVLGILVIGFFVWNTILRQLIVRRSRELARETIRSAGAALRLEERTRLAVELHDTIAQNLTGASFEIKAASKLFQTDPDKTRRHLLIADHTLQSCRDEIRNCIWDLRTDFFDQRDIGEALYAALAPHTGNASLKIRFNVPREKLSEPTLHALLQIVRELSINAVRHGSATEIRIAGSLEDHRLLFSVRDNGCGFDPTSAPGAILGHFGLQGVSERVRKLDGSMSIESVPGRGTHVAICLRQPTDTVK